jgi:hypothetical protein
MNATERDYGLVLEARKRAGEVAEYHFEALTFTLAADTRYTPDFVVVLAGGECELHEVKGGFYRDDAKVKAKVCARLYPFRVKVVRRDGKGWSIEDVAP